MKHLENRLAGVLALCLLGCLMLPARVFAAGEPYTYTVTLSMGRQGSWSGEGIRLESAAGTITPQGDTVVIADLAAGDRIAFDPSVAVVEDTGKYYVRGVRLSGRDNNKAAAPSFAVTEDADYVVAYGIKGELVQYTVNYVDTEGSTLAPGRSYYGNVGDEAVVAYLYIDGYQPQAYNLSHVLVSNAAENVFSFVYSRNAAPTAAPGEEPGPTATPADPGEIVIEVPTGPTASPRPGGGSPGSNPGRDEGGSDENPEPEEVTEEVVVEQPAAEPGAGNNGADGAGSAGGAAGQEETGVPEELTNIDENETPLAAFVRQMAEAVANATPAAKVGGGVAVGGLLLLLILLLLRRRKDKDEDEAKARPVNGETHTDDK